MSDSSFTSLRGRGFHFVPVALASLTAILAYDPLTFQRPASHPVTIPASITDTAPIRHRLERPVYTVGKFTFACGECHRTVPEPYTAGAEFTKHAEIHLAHGINRRCLNCHHPANREAFVDDFGNEIPWDQPQLSCAKCHGPVYRDWQHGSHGRINGYWDTKEGEMVRLKCIACHDPHHPPFPSIASAPPPRRFGAESSDVETHSGVHNPLRIYDRPQAGDHATDTLEGRP
jgi:hypothetical protein